MGRKRRYGLLFFLLLLLALAPGVMLRGAGSEVSEAIPVSSEVPDEEEDWSLLLVNAQNPLPEIFHVRLMGLRNGQAVDERAYPSLQAMMDAARAEGLSPLICSSYRNRSEQRNLYEDKVTRCMEEGLPREAAEAEAARWVAPPGTSEHETGLAVDIVSLDYQALDEAQANTPEQRWLMENSWKYGFILRYPADKTEITGIGYEPWHYRYVGEEAAMEMRERGLCLEEYVEQ